MGASSLFGEHGAAQIRCVCCAAMAGRFMLIFNQIFMLGSGRLAATSHEPPACSSAHTPFGSLSRLVCSCKSPPFPFHTCTSNLQGASPLCAPASAATGGGCLTPRGIDISGSGQARCCIFTRRHTTELKWEEYVLSEEMQLPQCELQANMGLVPRMTPSPTSVPWTWLPSSMTWRHAPWAKLRSAQASIPAHLLLRGRGSQSLKDGRACRVTCIAPHRAIRPAPSVPELQGPSGILFPSHSKRGRHIIRGSRPRRNSSSRPPSDAFSDWRIRLRQKIIMAIYDRVDRPQTRASQSASMDPVGSVTVPFGYADRLTRLSTHHKLKRLRQVHMPTVQPLIAPSPPLAAGEGG